MFDAVWSTRAPRRRPKQQVLSQWFFRINAFCRSSLYSNSLAAILLPIDVYTRGGWHLFGCNAELEWLGKTRSQRAGSFLEAVEWEACRLDRSGGSLYDVFAAGFTSTQK